MKFYEANNKEKILMVKVRYIDLSMMNVPQNSKSIHMTMQEDLFDHLNWIKHR